VADSDVITLAHSIFLILDRTSICKECRVPSAAAAMSRQVVYEAERVILA
jgi:hypothetical protein